MLGTQLGDLSLAGILFALLAALCRVISLLLTRAYLNGTDARLTTWYSMVPSTAMFIVATAWVGHWALPQSSTGWAAFAGVSICSTMSTLLIYISTNRIGPFRTALTMNLEPLVTIAGQHLLLGEGPVAAASRRRRHHARLALRLPVRSGTLSRGRSTIASFANVSTPGDTEPGHDTFSHRPKGQSFGRIV